MTHTRQTLSRSFALAALMLSAAVASSAQSSATTALLARARAQEQAGHIDLAAQTWQQVLLVDTRDRDALAGLARWAKLAGRDAEAKAYLDRLRQIDPANGNIAAIQSTSSRKVQTEQLQHAAQLAQQGHPDEALKVYRSVWGRRPPDGDWALAYYDTEAAIEADRGDAIEGLRNLDRKYPADLRYSVTLGRILTYTPQTRAEGMRLLEKFPQDTAAQKALHQAQAWSAQGHSAESESRQNAQRPHDIEDAAKSSRLWATVQRGTDALNADEPNQAIAAYKAALLLRPNTVEAMQGLGGSYIKAGQPEQAIGVYRQLVKLQPKSADAWHGLFNAQVQAGQMDAALDTAQRLPLAPKSTLEHDPLYLRSLASAYLANGHTSEAEKVLAQALALPASHDRKDFNDETRLQYAALLAENKQYAQAAALYRDILYDDPESVPAWQGIISMQHQAGHDTEALATVERMSPPTYDAALQDSGFLSTLAAIYRQQNRFNLAQGLLQRAARSYTDKGEAPPTALQLQLASVYLQQNQPGQAYDIFRRMIESHPDSIDAWKGLVAALHQTGRDRDALAQLRQIPVTVRRELDHDVSYQQTVAGIYAATGNAPAALQLIMQIQAYYRSTHGTAPAEVDIQSVWLLYNTHDDRDLYRALMAIGDRDDLSDDQRRSVQNIWATWSVRRAGEAVDGGNTKRAIEILNVASQAFPGNADIGRALAGGYLKAGDPRHAMDIYATLDLASVSSSDFQGMVGAALALPNLHQAEAWLRIALDKFGRDPKVLALAARFEQARGDHARAAGYLKASLAAMPSVDPANRLAHVLDRADAMPIGHRQSDSLSSVLDPENDGGQRPSRPSLPSYKNAYPTENIGTESLSTYNPLYGPDPYLQGTAPVQIDASHRQAVPAVQSGRTPSATERRGGFSPRSEIHRPDPLERQLQDESADAFAPPDLLSSTTDRQDNGGTRTETAANAAPTAVIYLQPQTSVQPAIVRPQILHGSMVQPEAPQQLQQSGAGDLQLQQQDLPPLRGIWSSHADVRETDPRGETERQLDGIQAGYSPWLGGTGYITHRTGTAGFDQLTLLESPFETSTTVGNTVRMTAIVTPSLLDSGISDGTSANRLGTLAVGAVPPQQNAAGVAAEAQLTSSNFTLAVGTTPRGFLVDNITGRLEWHPASGPLSFKFVRDAVKDSQLSYSGLRDPGSITSTFAGNPWGGVIANAGNLQYARGDASSGYYVGIGGQYLTGLNVQTNNRIDGVAGAYWKVLKVPESVEVTLGANFFGMHYAQNLRYFTYGQGGYFSPSAYFLANMPFTLKGQYGNNLHYSISGAVGLQAFQEDSSLYFPTHIYSIVASGGLNLRSSSGLPGSAGPSSIVIPLPLPPTPAPFNNPTYPAQSVVGGNYDLRAELSDHVIDRWYIGGFLAVNNTRNYASQTVGFFIRYMSRPQFNPSDDSTGNFPYTGTRPLLVP